MKQLLVLLVLFSTALSTAARGQEGEPGSATPGAATQEQEQEQD